MLALSLRDRPDLVGRIDARFWWGNKMLLIRELGKFVAGNFSLGNFPERFLILHLKPVPSHLEFV